MTWVAIGALAHLGTAFGAMLSALRTGAYSTLQSLAQGVMALCIPVVGPVLVFMMARQALAPPQKIEESTFDPLRIPSDGG